MFDYLETKNIVIISSIAAVVVSFGFNFLFGSESLMAKSSEGYSSDGLSSNVSEIDSAGLSTNTNLLVDLSGAVVNPGVYELPPGSRVRDLLGESGGIVPEANSEWVMKKLNLAEEVVDKQKIYIPFDWDFSIEEANIDELSIGSSKNKVAGVDDENLINVNNTTLEQLITLNGIGASYAERIINNSPYADIDDFTVGSGVPKKTIEKISKFLIFE
jgi:competence protein ComEA